MDISTIEFVKLSYLRDPPEIILKKIPNLKSFKKQMKCKLSLHFHYPLLE